MGLSYLFYNDRMLFICSSIENFVYETFIFDIGNWIRITNSRKKGGPEIEEKMSKSIMFTLFCTFISVNNS